MNKSTQPAYVMLVAGIALFVLGMTVDVTEHGLGFLISEFRRAPLAHGLPLAGLFLIILGTLRLR